MTEISLKSGGMLMRFCCFTSDCNADNLRFCLGALQGIQHHNYFRPRCNCNQSAVSPVFFQMCLDLRNAIYHHHCARLQPIRIRHQKRKLAGTTINLSSLLIAARIYSTQFKSVCWLFSSTTFDPRQPGSFSRSSQ